MRNVMANTGFCNEVDVLQPNQCPCDARSHNHFERVIRTRKGWLLVGVIA